MDALAVSIAAGCILGKVTGRQVFRIAFHFGLFQFLMPIAGWTLGQQVSHHVAGWSQLLAAVLLTLIGLKMVRDSRSPEPLDARKDPSRGWMLVTLSLATSVDALAVGASIALLHVDLLRPCVVIGVVAATFSAAGMLLAKQLPQQWSRKANLCGGILLVTIAAKIVLNCRF